MQEDCCPCIRKASIAAHFFGNQSTEDDARQAEKEAERHIEDSDRRFPFLKKIDVFQGEGGEGGKAAAKTNPEEER